MSQNRVQFTPDVLPADITGFSIYRKDTGKFEVPAGGGDVQPASGRRDQPYIPENTVRTAGSDGRRKCDGGWHYKRSARKPFIVMATQNPIGSSGTQMLPESQLDRFMICISMGYPDIRNRNCHFKDHRSGSPVDPHFTGDPDERSADNAGRSRQNLYP